MQFIQLNNNQRGQLSPLTNLNTMKELLLRMDFELFDRLKTQAKKNERSVTAEIKYILKNNVKK